MNVGMAINLAGALLCGFAFVGNMVNHSYPMAGVMALFTGMNCYFLYNNYLRTRGGQ
jgi:hypothetical protein